MLEKKKHIIMLVDDNKANLTIGKSILSEYYDVFALPSADKLFEFLKHVIPDLILLDIDMPGMNGYETITLLKADKMYQEIPVIFISAKNSESDQYEGLNLGAIDYITKPFAPPILLKRIENHLLLQRQKANLQDFNNNLIKMVKGKTHQLFSLQNAIISNMAELVEFRDIVTGRHISRTQKYLKKLMDQLMEDGVYAQEMLLWDMDVILLSSQLHDIGKITISDTILNKPGKLTVEETVIMRTHSQKGVEVIEKIEHSTKFSDCLEYAKLFAGTHHEKWNGSGYPNRLAGENIPLEGRIMAVADVYDALISIRPYKKSYSAEESARIILDGSGTHFDPTLIETFKKLKDEFAAIAVKYAD
ncbi:MAG: response regulator [Treponema sp.]|nr:response regulator [Treponema sp.]MCL2272014.1 response regulator [Treponema sp.]